MPPLGASNGGLAWRDVRPLIERALGDLEGVDVVLYEPTAAYQNVGEATGLERLTPARALIAEVMRRYEQMGLECSLLEVQKLAWVLTRVIKRLGLDDLLKLSFAANRYGPYADNLRHLLNSLDGSFLHCDRRLSDAGPMEVLNVAPNHVGLLVDYFRGSEGAAFAEAIEATDAVIDGFQSPLGIETPATVEWLFVREEVEPTVAAICSALKAWPASGALERKQRLFTDELIQASIDRLALPTHV